MATTSYLKNLPLKDKLPGMLDVDVFQEGEADLYKHHKSCLKHPDHKEFIPVDKFDITNLPTDYQDRYIVEYIKLVAQLTVRVTVKYVSPHRPTTIPGTDTPYPLYEHRGKHKTRVGNGLIINVICNVLIILTATHVVFDKEEVKHTSIHLFYDNGNQPADSKDATELKCDFLEKRDCNTITDQNVLIVDRSIHKSLIHKLQLIVQKLLEIRQTIKQRLLQNSYGRDNKPLTIIVSHPYGCSTKISIGKFEEIDNNLDDVKFLYTTPTCPGSSGAAVICLDEIGLDFNCVHSGTWEKDASLNLGSCRYGSFDSISLSDLKNPETITLDLRLHEHDFEPEFNRNLVMDLIWTISHMKVTVIYDDVSEHRPQFWSGSRRPYPFYRRRGKIRHRKGHHWVDRVVFYPNKTSPGETCDCYSRSNSSTPERKFRRIHFLTSLILVFDKTEKGLLLFKSNFTYPYLPIDLHFVRSNVENDRAELVIVAHDLRFSLIIEQKLELNSDLTHTIRDQYSKQLSQNPVAISILNNCGGRLGRCVETKQHLQYPIKTKGSYVGAPVIVIGNQHLNYEVSGCSGRYTQNVGYSRYLNYQFIKQNKRKENEKKRKLTDNMAARSLKHTQVMKLGLEESGEPAKKSARDDLMTPEEPQGDEIGKESTRVPSTYHANGSPRVTRDPNVYPANDNPRVTRVPSTYPANDNPREQPIEDHPDDRKSKKGQLLEEDQKHQKSKRKEFCTKKHLPASRSSTICYASFFILLGLSAFINVSAALPLVCRRGNHLHTPRVGPDVCLPCQDGDTYIPVDLHSYRQCWNCTKIVDPEREIMVKPCTKNKNSEILCMPGFYRRSARNPREIDRCEKCSKCEFTSRPCQGYHDSVCCGLPTYEAILNKEGIYICKEKPVRCGRGEYLKTSNDQCTLCPIDTYMPDTDHNKTECLPCVDTDRDLIISRQVVSACNTTHPALFECQPEFFRNVSREDWQLSEEDCLPCQTCQFVGRNCTRHQDTVCCPGSDMVVSDTSLGSTCLTPAGKLSAKNDSATTFRRIDDLETCGEAEYLSYNMDYSKDNKSGGRICVQCPTGTYNPAVNHTWTTCLKLSDWNRKRLPVSSSNKTQNTQDERSDQIAADYKTLLFLINLISTLLVVILILCYYIHIYNNVLSYAGTVYLDAVGLICFNCSVLGFCVLILCLESKVDTKICKALNILSFILVAVSASIAIYKTYKLRLFFRHNNKLNSNSSGVPLLPVPIDSINNNQSANSEQKV